nr:hypothetical protein [uncultured Oscillibacter sp.]
MTEAELYKKMYAILCGAYSEALDLLEQCKVAELHHKLTDALNQAEELYMSAEEHLT